jgi:oxygen-independent coproporphyrinogen-3 oxidase
MFRASHAPKLEGPIYCCQQDGMIGLGCGARSYTQRVHYGSDYAVRNSAIEGIIGRYVSQSDAEFRLAELGFELNDDEQRRRHLIMSLLQVDGVSLADYTNRFGTELNSDFPQLTELEDRGFLVQEATRMVLTPEGIERSDAIGPWLFSPRVNELMEQYQWE